MKKIVFLLVFLSVLLDFKSFAQGENIDHRVLIRQVDQQGQPDIGVEGSLYLNEEWQMGVVEMTNEQTIKVQARYRYYDNIIEIKKKNDETIYSLDTKYTRSITIGDKYFLPLSYVTEKGLTYVSFFELLTDGKFQLLIKYDKIMTEAVNNGYNDAPAKIKEKRIFFINDSAENEMTQLKKMNKKSILALFGKHSKKVETYAKKNKLSFKKAKGLAKIFEYYNSDCYVKPKNK